MSMKNNSKTSMMSLCFVLGLILIIVTAQFNEADCRALRSTANAEGGSGADAGGCEMAGMASFAVSSNNSSSNSNNSSSSRPLARSLAFRLASGPSKKGPGH